MARASGVVGRGSGASQAKGRCRRPPLGLCGDPANYDITPVLPQIFSDLSYAGMAGVELMHHRLRPDDAVRAIGELSRRRPAAITACHLTA